MDPRIPSSSVQKLTCDNDTKHPTVSLCTEHPIEHFKTGDITFRESHSKDKGTSNPKNVCYSNAIFQALLYEPDFLPLYQQTHTCNQLGHFLLSTNSKLKSKINRTIFCLKCDHIHKTEEIVYNFSLPIEDTIKDCLDSFFYGTLISNFNYKCRYCEKRYVSLRSARIAQYPQILCLLIDRIDNNHNMIKTQ